MTTATLPGPALAIAPAEFFSRTRRKDWTTKVIDSQGSGHPLNGTLPNVGVIGALSVTYIGTLDVTMGTGSITTAARWPHGLIDWFTLTLNGRSDLWSVAGDLLDARRHIEYPGWSEGDTAQVIPGGQGAGHSITADEDVIVTWRIPIPANRQSLIAALLAQAGNTNLGFRIREGVHSDLLVVGGNATFTLDGVFYIKAQTFTVPSDAGRLFVPDVNRYHAINQFPKVFSAAGTLTKELTPTNGALMRLLFQVADADPAGAITDPYLSLAADADEIDAVSLTFGANDTPYDYDPAHFLLDDEIDNYQSPLSYGWHVIDLVADNAERDVIHMLKVTDLTLSVDVNSGVTPAAGAVLNVAQETIS